MPLKYEFDYGDGQGHQIYIRDVLAFGKTEYHSEFGIFVTTGDAKVLVIEGREQTTSRNQQSYHECLTLLMADQPTAANCRALVLGAGPGATAAALLRAGWGNVVQVDIDRDLILVLKEFMPEWHQGSFDDPRVETVYGDARMYVDDALVRGDVFDAIVWDLTEPDSDPNAVFDREFFDKLSGLLADGGIFSAQVGYAGADGIEMVDAAVELLNQTELRGGTVTRDPIAQWAFYHRA